MASQYQRYGDYILNRKQTLGAGKFGTVWNGYRIIHTNQPTEDYLEPIAIKESLYDQQNIQQISTLQILTHPNIIRYIDYKISKDSLFLVMELCQGGTLQDLLMTFTEQQDLTDQVIHYYSQIVKGIKFMYEKNILHRDIKPSNILIKDNKIKIADFGTSKMKKQNEMIRTLVGTPLFASPQILQMFVGDDQSYTQKSDIWSLGLILYFMFHYQKNHDTALQRLKQSLPWKGKSPIDVLQNIKTKPLVFRNKNIPQQIKKIIQNMLTIDVEKRMSFKQFFQIKLFQTDYKKKHLNNQIQSLMNQSAVILELSQSQNYDEYELTLIINQYTKQPQFLKKQTIDFQILKLLEIKDSEDYEEREIMDAIKFYQIIKQEAQNSDQRENYNDLIFEFDCQIYQLFMLRRFFIKKLTHSNKGIRKSSQLQLKNLIPSVFDVEKEPENENELLTFKKTKNITEKYFAFGKRFGNLNIFLKAIFQELVNTSNIMEKQKLIFKVITPNQFLLQETKLILKKKKSFFLQNKEKINAVMPKNEIYLTYDLINCLVYEFCWKIKKQDKRKMAMKGGQFYEFYKEQRSKINIWQIINRILKAFEGLKL